MPPPLLAPPPHAAGRGESDEEWGCEAPPAPRPQPCELNTRSCGPFLAVAPDKLSARYDGNGAHGNDVGAVQADAPVPDDVAVFYFELRVVSAGARGCIGIGFTDKDFKTSRQPGCVFMRLQPLPPLRATPWRPRAGLLPCRRRLAPAAPHARVSRRVMACLHRGCGLAARARASAPHASRC